MKTLVKRDTFWNGSTIGCDQELNIWLHDHGSLTKRIQQHCRKFQVKQLRSSLARIAYDESALLGIAPQHLAYSREVVLYGNDHPVIFAHSTCAATHLQGAWSTLTGFGNKPLGAMLFSHPLIERKPLHFKALRSHHPLYKSASSIAPMPTTLWARRSLFYLHNAPLLVTEIFLPEILKLHK